MDCTEFVARDLAFDRQHDTRVDGTETGQAANRTAALRWWARGWRVEKMGLAEIQGYREYLLRKGLQRRTVNQHVGWVRGAFRWAAEVGLIPDDVPARMAVLRPLRVGASGARERSTVTRRELLEVAAEAHGHVGAMMRVQWLAGMRPGEVCRMRWRELREEGQVVIYAPERHKVEHHGLRRWIVLCPEAVGWLGPRSSGVVFPTRRGGAYSTATYRQEVQRACERLGIRRIRPGEIRRAAATEARRLLGAEHAQWLLGHVSTDMTERYFDLGWMDQVQAVGQLLDAGWGLSLRNC